MGQAIAAAPAIPDAVIGHGRSRAAQAAKTPGKAARLAPWVAEYQFNRNVLLETAEHQERPRSTFYLRAKDPTKVRELIAWLRHVYGEILMRDKPGASAASRIAVRAG